MERSHRMRWRRKTSVLCLLDRCLVRVRPAESSLRYRAWTLHSTFSSSRWLALLLLDVGAIQTFYDVTNLTWLSGLLQLDCGLGDGGSQHSPLGHSFNNFRWLEDVRRFEVVSLGVMDAAQFQERELLMCQLSEIKSAQNNSSNFVGTVLGRVFSLPGWLAPSPLTPNPFSAHPVFSLVLKFRLLN